jgi:short-subunit dehydrogenase
VIGYELSRAGVTVTTLCPGPKATGFAEVAQMEGSALFRGTMPVMQAAEVARLGYAAHKADRPVVVTGLLNRIIALSTRFAPSVLLPIASSLSRARASAGVKP